MGKTASAKPSLDTSQRRKAFIAAQIPQPCQRLLDVGCGPLTARYPYASLAETVVATDWKLSVHGTLPENVSPIAGDFTELDLGDAQFDAIVCADVFEHVQMEAEAAFVARCHALLRPGGHLIVTVPHAGRFAWLDPYDIKPRLHRGLHRLGLYRKLHNGTCDIRKGHKHYGLDEIKAAFSGFTPVAEGTWGLVYEPLAAWALALDGRGLPVPARGALSRGLAREADVDPGQHAYSCGITFQKPA